MIGPGIVIPLIALAILIPLAWWAATKRLRAVTSGDRGANASAGSAGARLTSAALHRSVSPPWRVILEVPPGRLGDVEHVLLGPPGIFAVSTMLQPLPDAPTSTADPSAKELAASAVARADLDDALATCALTSDALVVVHWGRIDAEHRTVEVGLPTVAVEVGFATVAVDGNRLTDWMTSMEETRLSPPQIDLAWQTICRAIGRPDPLEAGP